MGSTCAGTTPRSRFVKPYVEAPRQVIGFDLSPKGGKSGMIPDSDDDDLFRVDPSIEGRSNCTNSCSISSKTATQQSNSTSVTSPRSALQQLLLPLLPQSEPASSFPVADVIGLTQGPPSCKSQATKQCMRDGMLMARTKPTAVVECDPIPAAPLNYPIFKGITESVTPLRCATSGKNGISSAGAVSATKCVAGDGKKSCQAEARNHDELSWKSERNSKERHGWNFKDQLHELPPCRDKSKKSIWMEISIECPKTNSVEISWKQANMKIPEKSKKSSLFVLAASSPTAEYSKHYHLRGTDQDTSHNMDMNFLNSCYLCKRHLHQGHDVFMYSGDKAFCSMECRYQQIVIDERKGRQAPPVIRSGASPVYQSYMATSGVDVITAAATAATHHPITVNRPNFMNRTAAA